MKNKLRVEDVVKQLGENEKYRILSGMKETDLHKAIKELLTAIEPGSYVEITHGSNEYGKDLVMVRPDPFVPFAVGIVVKVGNIRSRAAREVDEIKSQVEQAIEHPALLKPIRGQQKISMVWVMVAGTLTRNAQRRLSTEIKSPNVEFLDLKWLADRFTKSYPYVFYEGEVSGYIERSLSHIENRQILLGKRRGFSEFYVEPKVATLQEVIEISQGSLTLRLYKDAKSVKQVAKELKPSMKLLMLGEPGSGKSTALARVASEVLIGALAGAIAGRSDERIGIPLLISANEISEIESSADLLDRYGPTAEVRDRFVIFVLLVDALDETSRDARGAVIQRAVQYSNELGCALLIASRMVDIVREETTGLEKRELLPLKFKEAVALFSKVVSDEQKLRALREGLERVHDQLPMTPLSLLLMIELVESNKEIPASIVELYDRYTDQVLGIEDRQSKGIEVLFDYQVKKRFLSALAWEEYLEKDRLEIPQEDFETFLNSYATEHSMDMDKLRDFVGEIERAGLMSLEEKVAFTHRSFLEYFAALRLFEKREEIPELLNYLTDQYFDGIWSDIVFYYAGMKREIPPTLLQRVFEYDGIDDKMIEGISKVLVGRLLQAAWLSLSKTKIYGIENSLVYCGQVVDEFLSYRDKTSRPVPRIYADIYTLVLCELAFGSKFLANEAMELVTTYLDNPTHGNILKAIHLLWPIRNKIPENEKDRMVASLLNATNSLSKSNADELESYARALMLLKVLGSNDPAVSKALEHRVLKEQKRYPGLFKKLLPVRTAGFRTEADKAQSKKRKVAKKKSK